MCLVAAGFGLPVGAFYWLGVAAVALLLGYEHSLVRPGDLRRLDTAFFTMNGVISVAFAVFVIVDAVDVSRGAPLVATPPRHCPALGGAAASAGRVARTRRSGGDARVRRCCRPSRAAEKPALGSNAEPSDAKTLAPPASDEAARERRDALPPESDASSRPWRAE